MFLKKRFVPKNGVWKKGFSIVFSKEVIWVGGDIFFDKFVSRKGQKHRNMPKFWWYRVGNLIPLLPYYPPSK